MRWTTGYLPWVHAIVSVLGARVFSSAAAFLANVLVARHLGPANFNSFYLLFAIMSIVAGLTGPAIDTSLVRFAVKQIAPGQDLSGPYFKFALYLKLLVLLVTLLAGFLCAQPLYNLLFVSEQGTHTTLGAIFLAFCGGAVVSIWGFAQSYFQAHQKFSHYAGFEFCSSFIRLALVVSLISLGIKSSFLFLLMYVTAPFAIGVVSWSLLPRELFRAPTTLQVGREFLQFAKWVLVATLFTTISQRMDLLLLNLDHFGIDKARIGQYGAALSLVLAGELVLLTFYSVLLPKASSLKTAGELRRFIGDFRLPSLFFCLATSLMIPLAGPFRHFAFGSAYSGTEGYFSILLLGVLVSIATAPTVTALYSLGHSRTMAMFELARLVFTLGLGLWTIPRYGIFGMACVSTLVRGGISAATYLVAHQTVKRQMLREHA